MTRVLRFLLAVVAVGALLWIAAELHYQGCVQAAEATTAAPVPTKIDELGGIETYSDERSAPVAACSRLPF